jgi:hypothetical protein
MRFRAGVAGMMESLVPTLLRGPDLRERHRTGTRALPKRSVPDDDFSGIGLGSGEYDIPFRFFGNVSRRQDSVEGLGARRECEGAIVYSSCRVGPVARGFEEMTRSRGHVRGRRGLLEDALVSDGQDGKTRGEAQEHWTLPSAGEAPQRQRWELSFASWWRDVSSQARPLAVHVAKTDDEVVDIRRADRGQGRPFP